MPHAHDVLGLSAVADSFPVLMRLGEARRPDKGRGDQAAWAVAGRRSAETGSTRAHLWCGCSHRIGGTVHPLIRRAAVSPCMCHCRSQLKKYFTFEVQVLDDKNVRRRFRASNYQVPTSCVASRWGHAFLHRRP